MQRIIQFAGPMLGLTGDEWTRDQLKADVRTGPDRSSGSSPQPGWRGPGHGRAGRRQDPDRRLEEAFKRMDKNEDGVLDTTRCPRRSRTSGTSTTPNHNGMIDLNEFKAYVAARRGDGEGDRKDAGDGARRAARRGRPGRRRPRTSGSGRRQSSGPATCLAISRTPRWTGTPTARSGCTSGRNTAGPISQFLDMDLNNDGFLTVDEYYRWKRQGEEQAAKAAGTSTGQFGRFGGMRGRHEPRHDGDGAWRDGRRQPLGRGRRRHGRGAAWAECGGSPAAARGAARWGGPDAGRNARDGMSFPQMGGDRRVAALAAGSAARAAGSAASA